MTGLHFTYYLFLLTLIWVIISRVFRQYTHLGHDEFFKVGGEVVNDAVLGARQGDATHKQDGQNHVREQSREVHHLSHKNKQNM